MQGKRCFQHCDSKLDWKRQHGASVFRRGSELVPVNQSLRGGSHGDSFRMADHPFQIALSLWRCLWTSASFCNHPHRWPTNENFGGIDVAPGQRR